MFFLNTMNDNRLINTEMLNRTRILPREILKQEKINLVYLLDVRELRLFEIRDTRSSETLAGSRSEILERQVKFSLRS